MRYKGFDLNLLVALDILIEERSVSRAAEKMNMSQPALSAALGRLRGYFEDPILGAHGKRMIPTAHALIPAADAVRGADQCGGVAVGMSCYPFLDRGGSANLDMLLSGVSA